MSAVLTSPGDGAPSGSISAGASVPDPGVSQPSRRSGVGRIVKETLLTIAGIGGILSLAWFVASRVFGLSLVIFMTGSMAPTLPTGSAAIVTDDVPAAELRVGDIVTVPRAGEPLPVTHRIVSIDSANPDAGANARMLTLRGDDNDSNDREPYTVNEADRVVVGAPHVGFALHLAQTPLFFGAMALGVALLVVWAFWPVDSAARTPRGRRTSRTTPQP